MVFINCAPPPHYLSLPQTETHTHPVAVMSFISPNSWLLLRLLRCWYMVCSIKSIVDLVSEIKYDTYIYY